MFRQSVFIAVLLTLCGSALSAQNDCAEKFDREGIYLRYEFWKGATYVQNGRSQTLGFAYRHLAPAFEKSPAALPLFRQSQRSYKIGTGFAIGTLVGILTGIVVANKHIDHNGRTLDERKFQQGVNLMAGSIAIGSTVSMIFYFKSRRQLDDALWERNRGLLR